MFANKGTQTSKEPDSGPEDGRPVTRRGFLGDLTLGLAAAGVAGIPAEMTAPQREEAQDGGTDSTPTGLNQPCFTALTTKPHTGIIPTYRDRLEAQLTQLDAPEQLAQRLRSIASVSRDLSELRQTIDDRTLMTSEPFLEALRTAKEFHATMAIVIQNLRASRASFDEQTLLLSEREDRDHDISNIPTPDLAAKYGDIESFVRALMREITGTDLPAGITFEVGSTGHPQILGKTSHTEQRITSQNLHYGFLTVVLAHEVGHLFARYVEPPKGDPREKVRMWEEASAFAMESIAACHIKEYEDLRLGFDIMTSYSVGFLNDYYDGKGATEHPQGMAYFDAALTVLGSPEAAFNFLISHRELSDEMKAVIADNAVTRLEVLEATKAMPLLSEIEGNYRELSDVLATFSPSAGDIRGE